MIALEVYGADADGFGLVDEAIVVCVVFIDAAISGAPDVDGAFSSASVGDAVCEGADDEGVGLVEGEAVIGSAPAVVADIDDVGAPGEGFGFFGGGDFGGEDFEANDVGPGGGSSGAEVVISAAGDDSGDAGAVTVVGAIRLEVEGWGGIVWGVVVPVVVDGRIDVGGEVFVSDLDAVIDDGNGDTGAEVGVPDAGDIYVESGDAPVLAGVFEVPLVGGV